MNKWPKCFLKNFTLSKNVVASLIYEPKLLIRLAYLLNLQQG